MKNFHRRAKLEDSEENGVINFSTLLWPDCTSHLLHIKREYTIYFVYAGLQVQTTILPLQACLLLSSSKTISSSGKYKN